MKKKSIICLGAGTYQEPLIKSIINSGYSVIAIDRNYNAVGFKYADHSILKSTYSFENLLPDLLDLEKQYKIMGVLNRSSGLPVIVAAEISKYFDIPALPVENAAKIVHKHKLRESCISFSIPSPKHTALNNGSFSLHKEFKFPLVVKPSLSLVGKSGVTLVNDMNQMSTAIKYAEDTTMNNKILIEEYLPGQDFSLISFVNNNQLFPICFLDEINKVLNDGTIYGQGFKTHPLKTNDGLEDEAIRIATLFKEKFKIERSPLILNFRQDFQGSLRLIEVHLDLGGDSLIEGLFPRALPYNFLEMAVGILTGDDTMSVNHKIRPTAIFFEKGDEIITKRKFVVFSSDSQTTLDNKINEAGF